MLISGPASGVRLIAVPLIVLIAPIALLVADELVEDGAEVCDCWAKASRQEIARMPAAMTAVNPMARNRGVIERIGLSLIYIGRIHKRRDLQSFTLGAHFFTLKK
jgi:hypothetical protein